MPAAPATSNRIDTAALKREHPMEIVAARYGVELRRSGRALVGRCPFHDDRGRPNLHVYPDQDRWFCYRCNEGGDALTWIQRIERVDFLTAVERLGGRVARRSEAPSESRCAGVGGGPTDRARDSSSARPKRARQLRRAVPHGPAERACLTAATELYHNCRLSDGRALAYMESRGLDRATIERCRVGFAGGDELAPYLHWRRLPVQAAMRAGLLRSDGRELLAGRIVVPEIRGGETLWMVGRTIEAAGAAGQAEAAPKYLGLPGQKPLLGWEGACASPTVCLTEGVFDYLTLAAWDVPALALVGTRVRPDVVEELSTFRRVYVVLDGDEAGQLATDALLAELAAVGAEGVPVLLPGVKDVAELATHPDGQTIFGRAILRAAGLQPASTHPSDPSWPASPPKAAA